MRSRFHWLVASAAVLAILALPAPGSADHATREQTPNIVALGDNEQAVPLPPGLADGSSTINTDIGFWGNRAIQGNWNGFRVLDIADPNDPQQLAWYQDCNGGQGDVLVWNNLVIRSWNSPVSVANTGTLYCGRDDTGAPMFLPTGWEGLHIFDISDLNDIELVESVRMDATTTPLGCGSHTATLVPDLANNRLLVYNSASSGTCPGIDIVEIPLSDPTNSTFLRREAAGRSCHDTQVFLGDVLLASCAGGNGFTLFTMDPDLGGSLLNPFQLYTQAVPDVSIGHSSAFSWDGEVLIFGHEPGGGTQAQCQDSSLDANRTMFFYETDTGRLLGRWFMPRAQSSTENCTIHNFNVVPTTDDNRIVVSGNYQAGTWVTDFTDPTRPKTVAYSDPAPLDENTLMLGGAWSTYWYNGHMYETDIAKGLHVFGLNDPLVANAVNFPFMNPQTQMERIPRSFDFSSAVNITHRTSPHVFRGQVTSEDGRCVAGRSVVIRKMLDGPDRNVGRDTTDALGRYEVRHNLGGAGRYYARVVTRSFLDGIDTINCLRDDSGWLRVAQ